jgi:pimeloyl-ACP methyl ester carboxylesterase
MQNRKLFPVLAAFLVLLPAFFSTVSAQAPEAPYSNSHFVTVDSVKIHYRSWNDDMPHPKGKVLLVHGFIGSTFCWRETFDTLVHQGYRVIAVDLPGFGYSDRNPEINQSQSNRARILWDLAATIDKGDTSRWNLAGHSMGGGTVEAMALLRPSRIKTLVIVDGMVFTQNAGMLGEFVTLSRLKAINQMLSSYTERVMLTYSYLKLGLGQTYGYTPDSSVIMGYLNPLMIDGTGASVISVWSNSKEVTPLDASDMPKIPVFLIWGKKDNVIALRYGKKFMKKVPQATLKVIPGAYHSPMETHPAVFNKLYIGFLSKHN